MDLVSKGNELEKVVNMGRETVEDEQAPVTSRYWLGLWQKDLFYPIKRDIGIGPSRRRGLIMPSRKAFGGAQLLCRWPPLNTIAG